MANFLGWLLILLISTGVTTVLGFKVADTWKEYQEGLSVIKEKEHRTPKVDIKLFPSGGNILLKGKSTRREYDFMLQNLNKKTVPVQDLRIELFFPYNIKEISLSPMAEPSQNSGMSGLRVRQEINNELVTTYEEQPLTEQAKNNCTFEILKAIANGIQINTNTAVFSCTTWPERTSYFARIIIDLSEKPSFTSDARPISTYSGNYSYIVQGRSFSEKIANNIPLTD